MKVTSLTCRIKIRPWPHLSSWLYCDTLWKTTVCRKGTLEVGTGRESHWLTEIVQILTLPKDTVHCQSWFWLYQSPFDVTQLVGWSGKYKLDVVFKTVSIVLLHHYTPHPPFDFVNNGVYPCLLSPESSVGPFPRSKGTGCLAVVLGGEL